MLVFIGSAHAAELTDFCLYAYNASSATLRRYDSLVITTVMTTLKRLYR
ncbi:hypothetical protein PF003_g24159 [Phytophthora fragariae]|nr:hypothetical protein PF003_g24159 [Phytophthora fragariae]